MRKSGARILFRSYMNSNFLLLSIAVHPVRSLGNGYVSFIHSSDADRAMETLNFSDVKAMPYVRVKNLVSFS